jgi:type I restriction enzyme S subunit
LAVKVDRETGRLGEAFISNRFHITNANNADIPTTFFVNPAHSGVSALIGCAQDRRHGSSLELHVVHNPLAAVQLPIGSIGGSDDEWLATPVPGQADEFELQQANPQRR